MKLDIELATRNLRLELEALDDLKPDSDPAKLVARMYAITRLLWHDPVVAPVASEVTNAFSGRHVDIRRQVWASDSVSKELAALAADHLEALLGDVSFDQPSEAVFAVAELRHTSKVEGKQYFPKELLRKIAEPGFVGQDDLLVAVDETVGRIGTFLANARTIIKNERLPAKANDVLQRLRQSVQETTSLTAKLTRYVEALCLRDSVAHLQAFDSWMTSLAAGQLAGADCRQIPDIGLLRECTWAIKQISSRVLHQLSAASGTFHALRRMKAYFEHFARAELIEHIRKGRKRREERIQEMLDRFLFNEGVFPITHCAASGGLLDTFIATEALPRLETAADNEIPAMLIELKQKVTIDAEKQPSESAIKNAVKDALGQASTYADHLAANPRWSNPHIYAVVFYSGKQRYHSTRNDVVLVYLGDKTPKFGSKPLEIA